MIYGKCENREMSMTSNLTSLSQNSYLWLRCGDFAIPVGQKKNYFFSSPLCFSGKKIKAVSRYVALSFLKAPPKNEKEFKVFKKLKNRNET